MKTKSIFRLYASARWGFYILIISISFIISTIGNGVKPLLLIPVAIGISINEENEITAVITGILCGFLLDISCDRIFGYNAILLVCICVISALMFIHYLRVNIINFVLTVTIFSFLHDVLDYLFYYAIWDYENVRRIFFDYTLPSWLYTSMSSIIVYIFIRLIKNKFSPKAMQTINEETQNTKE